MFRNCGRIQPTSGKLDEFHVALRAAAAAAAAAEMSQPLPIFPAGSPCHAETMQRHVKTLQLHQEPKHKGGFINDPKSPGLLCSARAGKLDHCVQLLRCQTGIIHYVFSSCRPCSAQADLDSGTFEGRGFGAFNGEAEELTLNEEKTRPESHFCLR